MLPVLVWVFGIHDAVPILTIAQLMGNLSRVWFNRTELSLSVVKWFGLGAVPAAVAGGIVFATAPATALVRVLGLFLLIMVAYRNSPWAREIRIGLRGFLPLGATSDYIRPCRNNGAVHGAFFPRLWFGRGCVHRNRSFGYRDDARHEVECVWWLRTHRPECRAGGRCHWLHDVRGIIPR